MNINVLTSGQQTEFTVGSHKQLSAVLAGLDVNQITVLYHNPKIPPEDRKKPQTHTMLVVRRLSPAIFAIVGEKLYQGEVESEIVASIMTRFGYEVEPAKEVKA